MGGASRAEKRRKQQVAEEKLRRAGITPPAAKDSRRTTFVAVAVLAVVALVVTVVFLINTRGSDAPVTPTYPVATDGGVVVAGTGPIVVDVYADFLCPVCERFEERYGTELTEAMNAGQVTVRYHSIAILDERTTPPGYSTRAAAAALCAADAGVYPAYHDRLFADQPAEGSAGLTDQQLIAFGTDAGANLSACITGGEHTADVTAATEAAVNNTALRNEQGQFGTPTVLLNGARVDLGNGNWLQNALPS